MKKIITYVLLSALALPSLALAKEDEVWTTTGPGLRAVVRNQVRKRLKKIQGEIITVSKDAVTIATESKAEHGREQVQVHIMDHYAVGFTELLGRGLGKQAELICADSPRRGLILLRINSIEGVDVGDQPDVRPEIRKHLRKGLQKKLGSDFHYPPGSDGIGPGGEFEPGFGPDMMLPESPGMRITDQETRRRGHMPMLGRSEHGLAPGGRHMLGRRGFGLHQSPELRKLEQETHRLAEQYRQAKGQEKEQLEEKLRDKLSATFEKKSQLQSEEVERLERQLEKLHRRLEKRQQNREAIIERRFSQLTQQEDELSW